MITIGLVQLSAGENLGENLESLLSFCREAGDQGCQAVCFPECSLTGYRPEAAAERSVPSSHPVFDRISQAAAEFSLDILAGFMERDGDGFFITHGLFRRDGSRAFYRKTHLGRREEQFFTPGDTLPVFPLSCGLQAGFQLCVETHFPEITQTLALKGVEIVFAPHGVPRVSGHRQRIWDKYIRARSYDNRLYLACCNLWDEDRFGGGLLLTDPRGETAASCFGPGPRLLICQVDEDLIRSYRTQGSKPSSHFYPARRRPELYCSESG